MYILIIHVIEGYYYFVYFTLMSPRCIISCLTSYRRVDEKINDRTIYRFNDVWVLFLILCVIIFRIDVMIENQKKVYVRRRYLDQQFNLGSIFPRVIFDVVH